MPPIKSISAIAKKWSDVTPGRAQHYAEGVANPRTPWEAATVAAEEAQHAGVTAAIAERRFVAGVTRAGNTKWSRGCLTKGVIRWGPGVRLARSDYEEGFKPYRDEIASIELPPRGPRGDPANIERVRIIAERLHALKRSLSS